MPLGFRQVFIPTVTTATLGGLALLTGCATAEYRQVIKENAQANAREYTQELGYNVQGASCSDTDSDSNGYVRCTVVLALTPAQVTQKISSKLQIECGYGYYNINGCAEVTQRVNPAQD